MLACSVIAKLWKETYANASLLEENVICITFGQPLIQIPPLQEAIEAFPKLEKTIHQIFNKEDIIPGLLHYYRLGCLHFTKMKSLGSQLSTSKPKSNGSNDNPGARVVRMLMMSGNTNCLLIIYYPLLQDFSCQFGQLFLPDMATLQKVANKKVAYKAFRLCTL